MNEELNPSDIRKPGEIVRAHCKCGVESDYTIRVFSNGTRHAWGTCPACGKTNAKQQRLPPSLEDLKHRIMGMEAAIRAMPPGVTRDEAVAMVERMAERLGDLT